ncbi:MAG: EthD family reductase [Hydrogenophaga sp.]|uniref:EthD family reductase n=1 Tax=Hydrogenophaga sp. TaxID=1904254 RepID=UPI003D0CED91
MIFRSGVFSRKEGISEAQFGDHWFKVHGHLASFMPGLHRYLQNHIRERLFEVQPFPDHEVGGISQQWFDDVAAMERCEQSPEYAAVKRDIPNFQGAITILVLAGEPVFGTAPVPEQGRAPGGPANKLLVLSRRRPAAPEGARPAQLAPAEGGPFAYVQNTVVDSAHPVSANVPSGKVPVEAMAELFFDSEQGLRDWVVSPAGQIFIHRHPSYEPLAAYAVNAVRIM